MESKRWARMQKAIEFHAEGKNYVEIGKELEITRQTASKYVNDGLALQAEMRSHNKERAISRYERVIKEAWKRLAKTDNRSLNTAGLLNTIRQAQERIDKLLGSEAPAKSEQKIEDQRRERVLEELDALAEDTRSD